MMLTKDQRDAQSPDASVRLTVAKRTDDQAVLTRMADDTDWRVRYWVARRTTNQALLTRMARDPHGGVRRCAVERLAQLTAKETAK